MDIDLGALHEPAPGGDPEAVRGGEIGRLRVRGPGDPVDPGQVLALCRAQMSSHKVPSQIVVDHLPGTSAGKIRRGKLAGLLKSV